MKQLLTDIQNRLAAAVQADDSPLLAYVDLDWGQVDFYEGMPPVKFPCALIDVQNATYSNEGQRVQLGDIMVQIRIVDMILSHSSAAAPAAQREKAARVFDLLREIHRLLHGWTGTPARYGRLVRKTLARVRRRDGLHEYTMTFEVVLTDDSARPQRQPVTVEQIDVRGQ
ncbi:MAG: hypothetical protein LBF19_03400 [Prevotellaceae bacterium]|jgi:hypothetical protein|nr:hypothetical protein [Prevotellaceae bacterium]